MWVWNTGDPPVQGEPYLGLDLDGTYRIVEQDSDGQWYTASGCWVCITHWCHLPERPTVQD